MFFTKKASFALIILLVILGACGCMSNNNKNKAEKTKDAALEYLEQKYNDDFKPLSYMSDSWAYNYSTVFFESKKYGEATTVQVYSGNSEYTFEDDYFKLVMHDDSEEFFSNITKKYGLNAVVKTKFVSFSMPESLGGNLSFDEYVASKQCDMEVYFITNSDIDPQIVENILADICNAKVMGNMKFLVTSDENLLNDYEIDAIANNEKEFVKSKTSYFIDNEFKIYEQ